MNAMGPHKPYVIALSVFFVVVLGVIFLPGPLYGALLESQVEGRSEDLLGEYAERVGRRIRADPAGDSWRDTAGARVLDVRRPAPGSLVISTSITVEVGNLFFVGSELKVRCYDISFTNVGTPGQRYDLDKVPGCDEEVRGPAIPGPP